MCTNSNHKVYYQKNYWNDYEQTRKHINRIICGDESIGLIKFLRKYISENNIDQFKKALILNCGNGWVEREMYVENIAKEYIGIDCSSELLEEAKSLSIKMPICYHLADTNKCDFPIEECDLVVNHAACHHITYLDKVLFNISQNMSKNGMFFSYDYVGPHRNQYTEELWNEIKSLNKKLHPLARNELSYPHLPTMLATDPTEAIHSELFVETHNRYFETIYHRKIGGCLAYPILTFNNRLSSIKDEKLKSEQINFVLEEDQKYIKSNPNASFFDLIISKPKNIENARNFIQAEKEREEKVNKNFGVYYPLSDFQKEYISSSFMQIIKKQYNDWTDYMLGSINRYLAKDFVTAEIFFEKALELKNRT